MVRRARTRSEGETRFSFESPGELRTWRTLPSAGSLTLTLARYKDGRHSLRWDWCKGSALILEELALDCSRYPHAGMEGWIYSEEPMPGALEFRLGTVADLAADQAVYRFRLRLGFSGWRMFRILFERDAKTDPVSPARRIERLEIHPPAEVPHGSVWLDGLVLSSSISPQRSADFQIPEFPVGQPGGGCEHWHYLYSQAKPWRALPKTITDAHRQAFARIQDRYFQWLLGHGVKTRSDDPALLRQAARETTGYIRRGWETFKRFGVRRWGDGRITGPGLMRGRGEHTFYRVFYDMLLPLAFDWRLNGNMDARDAVLLLFDYVYDQGWAEGSGLGDLWLNCLMFAPYGHAIALLREELAATNRLERAVRTAFWYQTFGKAFSRFDREYVETNADALRSIVFTAMVMILTLEDSPQKVQYMLSWKDWLEHALAISPRFAGVFKPDGLGFHHYGVYAGAYTSCAYEFCSLIAWLLSRTLFELSPSSRAVLKRALLTQDAMSHKYDLPYAAMGRMPRPGPRLLSAYAFLAMASEPPDPDLAGIFMRLWDPKCRELRPLLRVSLDSEGGQFLCLQTPGRLSLLHEFASKGTSPSPPPEGFWSLPWGALAIHRRGRWMAAVKGWSQYVWDFEMHPASWARKGEENVYGRYLSYGTLQLFVKGRPIGALGSGWNLDQGWDWCRWPGSTTPHLSLRELYDPKTSWATRFFSAAKCVGAVSSERRDGLFALKIHEHFYDPTFRAYKTYFFFDQTILCLGSNIESRDPHPFGTTLFQSWMPDRGMIIRINGLEIREFPFRWQGRHHVPVTLMDPYGNGYWVPDSGDLRVERRRQRSRDAWNRGPTEGDFSVAWIDHGRAPKDDGFGSHRYHYAVLVQTTTRALERFARTPPYRVLQQDHQAHVVEQVGHRTMAYAVFETDWEIPYGRLRRTDTPILAMVRELEEGRILLSVADPDLRLPKRRNMGYLDGEALRTQARASSVRLELRGAWRAVRTTACNPSEDSGCSKNEGWLHAWVEEAGDRSNERTHLVLMCRYGETREIELAPCAVSPQTQGIRKGSCERNSLH